MGRPLLLRILAASPYRSSFVRCAGNGDSHSSHCVRRLNDPRMGPAEHRNRGAMPQCGWLLNQFTSQRTQVIVPSISLSEYLTAFDPSQHIFVRETLAKRFLFRSFTDECAPLAAKLFRLGSQMRTKGVAGGPRDSPCRHPHHRYRPNSRRWLHIFQ
jgi:hypothetical protein